MRCSILNLSIAAIIGSHAALTSADVFTSSPNLAIPDGAYNGTLGTMACNTIDASSIPSGATVTHVELQTAINHTWIGDLVIKLISPEGTTLGVVSRPGFNESADNGSGCCGSNSDMASTHPLTFRDGASISAENMGTGLNSVQAVCRDGPQNCAFFPFPASIAQPPSNFAGFNGEDASGDWMLCIGDAEFEDPGMFVSWTLTVDHNGGLVVPGVGLTPASADFGNVGLGSTSAAQTVEIENTGAAGLDLGTLAISGANAADFTLSNDTCSGETLAPAATCTFDIALTSQALGARSAQVDIPSNAPSNPDSLPLTGTGVDVGIGLTPVSADFGNVSLGSTSAAQTVEVENTGAIDIILGTLAISGANAADFTLSNDTCSGETLAPAATCTFDIALTPQALGARSAQVDIPSDAPSSSDVVPLSGAGVSPAGASGPVPLPVTIPGAWRC